MSLQPLGFPATCGHAHKPQKRQEKGERFAGAEGREFTPAFRPLVARVDLGYKVGGSALFGHLGTARGGGVLGGADIGKGLRAWHQFASPIERCDPP